MRKNLTKISIVCLLIIFSFSAVWYVAGEPENISTYAQIAADDRDAVMGSNYQPTLADRLFFPFLRVQIPEDAYPGIDVSHWQGIIDWQMAYASGARFAFIRAGSADATSCEPYKDSQLERNAVEAPANDVYVDYYWFFRPQCNAITQAQAFAEYISGKEANMYPVADVEINGGVTASQVASAVWVFQDQLTKLTGRPTMIYTSPGFWNGSVSRTTWAHTLPLWVAHWNVSTPMLPYDWSNYSVDYTFWQYGVLSDGPEYGMESDGLDHDVYNGTEAEFIEQFVEEEPQPTECPTIESITIKLSDGTEVVLEKCEGEDYNCYCEWLPAILNEGE